MPYQTFMQQVASHIEFLRSNGLDVEALAVDAGFVRCRAIDESDQRRGEYAYRTQKNPLNKPGLIGLVTWFRGPGGRQSTHSTYGFDGEVEGCSLVRPLIKKVDPGKAGSSEDVESKARYLWDQAKEAGRSDYLERKGVGSYSIRFLENEYGRVAVIPARDGSGTIRTLQFLNADGAKRFLKGSAWAGLFHKLGEPANGQIIGLSESYVTAASCLELSGIPVVCAFSSGNLPAVAKSLLEMYPASRIMIFADNDRHLEAEGLPNQGTLKAQEAQKTNPSRISLAIPDFCNLGPSKEASDWNDLVRLRGKENARDQILKFLKGVK